MKNGNSMHIYCSSSILRHNQKPSTQAFFSLVLISYLNPKPLAKFPRHDSIKDSDTHLTIKGQKTPDCR